MDTAVAIDKASTVSRTVAELYAPDTLGTDAHLDMLDELRALGDVVELAPGSRRTFIVLGHAALREAACAMQTGALSSSFGTGVADVPEVNGGASGVAYRAINTLDGVDHAAFRASLRPLGVVDAELAKRARLAADVEVAAAVSEKDRAPLEAGTTCARIVLAAMSPRFGLADDVVAGCAALAHRAAFAWHDATDAASTRAILADVDQTLVKRARTALANVADVEPNPNTVVGSARAAAERGELSTEDAAWLVRFAFLTAFVTTELAAVAILENIARGRLGGIVLGDELELRLRAEPAARSRFIAESLRAQSPVARFGRVAVDDIALANVAIPKGARVILSFAAANHDPRVYANPRALDLDASDRPVTSSFAFGAGPHACLGAGVALTILGAIVDAVVDAEVALYLRDREPLRSIVNRGARRARFHVASSRP